MSTQLLPWVLSGFLALVVGWPTVRTWRRTGRWPIGFTRGAAPLQRAAGLLFGGVIGALAAWSVFVVRVGAADAGVWEAPREVAQVGWGAIVLGTVWCVVAEAQMGVAWRVGIDDRPTALVSHGLFRVCRNPVFTGMLLALLGIVAIAPSPWSLGLWGVTAAAMGLQVRLEERHLRRLHGLAYVQYASRVGRFLPGLGRIPESRRAPRAA